MAKKGLDNRHRDTTGRVDKKHGNTRIGSRRAPQGHDAQDPARRDRHGVAAHLLAQVSQIDELRFFRSAAPYQMPHFSLMGNRRD